MTWPTDTGGAGFEDRIVYDYNIWIPKRLIGNVEAVKRAATLMRVERNGSSAVKIYSETDSHIILPRHLYSPEELRGKFPGVKIEQSFGVKCWRPAPAPAGSVRFEDQIQLRPRQVKAWEKLGSADFGVLNLGCGGGKTVLGLKKVANVGGPALVLVNSGALLEQWSERAQEFLGLDLSQIGTVQSGKREWDKPLVIGMVQTIANLADEMEPELRKRFRIILFDECHHMSARTFLKTADLFSGQRFGLTATPNRTDGLDLAYLSNLGPIFYSDLETDMTSDVIFVQTAFELEEKDYCDRRKEFNRGIMYRNLGKIYRRNELIAKHAIEALGRGRKLIVLTHNVEHTALMEATFLDLNCDERYTTAIVTGNTKPKDRLPLIKSADVTFATYGVAEEALDVVQLDTLFLATPFKKWGTMQQAKGRIERASEGKKKPLVLVYQDMNIGPAKAFCYSIMRGLKENGFTYRTKAE